MGQHNWRQEDDDAYDRQTVQYHQEASVRGVQAVKSNGRAAGVDRQTIEQFDADLRNNLYKLWNRMSSEATFRRRCGPSPFPRSLGASGFWVCRS
jgi:retron-type reverse transcriptase